VFQLEVVAAVLLVFGSFLIIRALIDSEAQEAAAPRERQAPPPSDYRKAA